MTRNLSVDDEERHFLDESAFAKVVADENGLDAILIGGRVYKLEGMGKAHTSYFVSALRGDRRDSSDPRIAGGFVWDGAKR